MLPVSKKHAKAAKIKIIFFIFVSPVTLRFQTKQGREKEICIPMSTDLC